MFAPMRSTSILPPGALAPNFTLKATPDQQLALSDFRGQPVVLAFYPADWSPVCGDQLGVYNQILDEFRRYDAQLIGISVDGVWCHLAYTRERSLCFPLLSDFEPKGSVAEAYGAYDDQEGVCERALFVIDAQGRVAWSHLSPMGINPGADGILEALAHLHASQPQHPEAQP